MKPFWLVLVCFSCTTVLAASFEERVASVLHNTPLIDGHNDIPWAIQNRVNNQLVNIDLNADLAWKRST